MFLESNRKPVMYYFIIAVSLKVFSELVEIAENYYFSRKINRIHILLFSSIIIKEISKSCKEKPQPQTHRNSDNHPFRGQQQQHEEYKE